MFGHKEANKQSQSSVRTPSTRVEWRLERRERNSSMNLFMRVFLMDWVPPGVECLVVEDEEGAANKVAEEGGKDANQEKLCVGVEVGD